MKTEDFERLKTICEKEGFVVSTGGLIPGSSILVEVYKKDPWEGVEFVDNGLMIRKIKTIEKGLVFYEGGSFNHINECKPSTEEAYVDQLKKEALERFGEIKEGYMFIDAHSKDQLKVTHSLSGFVYSKDLDSLCIGGVIIYYKGKWAERVKERVEVQYKSISADKHNLKVEFELKDAVRYTDIYKGGNMARFLAEQMEKYLNNEL